jgi:hypothetical protein
LVSYWETLQLTGEELTEEMSIDKGENTKEKQRKSTHEQTKRVAMIPHLLS